MHLLEGLKMTFLGKIGLDRTSNPIKIFFLSSEAIIIIFADACFSVYNLSNLIEPS